MWAAGKDWRDYDYVSLDLFMEYLDPGINGHLFHCVIYWLADVHKNIYRISADLSKCGQANLFVNL